jgi:hypothetical protein
MAETDVAAFIFLCIFGLPTAGFVIIRMMQHRERMEMIKRGMPPPGQEARWGQYAARPGASREAMPCPPWARDPASQLRKGIGTTCIGVALLIGLSFIGYHGDGTFSLGPWLLGGLIPMFVGIAQIINALLAGATFPSSRMNAPGSPPPSGPYAYRPGSTEELPRTKPPQTP